MSVKCRDIMWMMEDMAPAKYAEQWDNPGLNIGDPEADINKILVALDATENVIDEAIAKGADMIITHHPLLFHAVKKINYNMPDGRKIMKLIKNNINHFAAHTNLDAAKGGTNDRLADIIGLKDISVLSEGQFDEIGIGRVGIIDGDTTMGMLAVRIKEGLGLDAVRVTGNLSRKVKKVALCTGAGAEFIDDAVKAKCDVYVTSDIKYHEAMDAVDKDICLIDATHYATENIIVPVIADYLRRKLENRSIDDIELLSQRLTDRPLRIFDERIELVD